MPDSSESAANGARKSTTLREKLRRVRRDLTKSIRMDRSTDPQLDIIPSPFLPYGYDPEASSYEGNSPPYQPATPEPSYRSDTPMPDREQLDGPSGMFGRKRTSPPVAAIFVHAGAGYHSTTNEQYHLGACNE